MEEQKLPIEKELEQIMALGEPIEENMVGKCECLRNDAATMLLAAVFEYEERLLVDIASVKRGADEAGVAKSSDVQKMIEEMEKERRMAHALQIELPRFKTCD